DRPRIAHFHGACLFVNFQNFDISVALAFASIYDCSLAGSGGLAAIGAFMRARLLPKMVVIPVSVILGGGGLLNSGSGGGGGGLMPKTLRSTMLWYGLVAGDAGVI